MRRHTQVGKATKVIRFISIGREVIMAATVCPATLRFIRIKRYDWRRASPALMKGRVEEPFKRKCI